MSDVLTTTAFPLGFATPAKAAAAIQKIVSPGGIEALFVQDTTLPALHLLFAFDGGATQDPVEKQGLANLVAGLLDQGAGSMGSLAFQDKLERLAMGLHFHASREHIYGAMRTLTINNAEAFGLLGLALSSTRFDEAALERIRARELSRLNQEATIPQFVAMRKSLALAFPDHAYGRSELGSFWSLHAIAVEDLRDFARRIFAKDKLKVAVVGDTNPEVLGMLLDKAFGALPPKGTLIPVPDTVATQLRRRVVVPLDVPQTTISFIAPGIDRGDPDEPAAYLANEVLGRGDSSSRLFQEVRERRGLAYSVHSTLIQMDHSALFAGHAASRSDRASETIAAIECEVKRMTETGPTEQELAIAKSHIAGSELLAMSGSSRLAASLLQTQIEHKPVDFDVRRSLFDTVTLEDVKRAAKRLWCNGLSKVLVGPGG
ncbi:insulinase family protein [Bradyrhizobium sp. 83012]|uniref:Insulinase family protein n=1 Tax=Bradyrhizobium aeschynomenes TaxID=2734909 RepID=A0ABX2CPC6_9BRAD|nr:pitrilysin family protein [Bradyrhizobium aeschynomenes]NPU15648.1 insulinase family protein [Bradyrhizobium aeschynomenes]NPU69705.1 insulinase family protein [Bradyrhizobium aeschynomenes]NPV24646.1 insulinase family protein [Bradyrhizobium aeschynomenes]